MVGEGTYESNKNNNNNSKKEKRKYNNNTFQQSGENNENNIGKYNNIDNKIKHIKFRKLEKLPGDSDSGDVDLNV